MHKSISGKFLSSTRSSLCYSMPPFLSTLIDHSLFSDFHSTEHYWHVSHSGSLLEYRCNSGGQCNIIIPHHAKCKCSLLQSVPEFCIFFLLKHPAEPGECMCLTNEKDESEGSPQKSLRPHLQKRQRRMSQFLQQGCVAGAIVLQ